ncbi:helix-turn-helix domain-containing protein [Ochrobactrum soli]|uniref:Transcriptional regulator, AraC family n=1 Tax=Ochrobactrum soli TaxID=2448455 RepID=A0A2P9HE89_9HYPH|nr:AraC family transcriptional regulator [[Ochrobactrum] soli]SPL62426.1 Transcriptional regulator, AraC family [[Ochrobactrum] soli]
MVEQLLMPTSGMSIVTSPSSLNASPPFPAGGAMRLMNHSGVVFENLFLPRNKVVVIAALTDSKVRIHKNGNIEFDGRMSAGTAKVYGVTHIVAADILSPSDVLFLPFEQQDLINAAAQLTGKHAALRRTDAEFTVRGAHIEQLGKRFLAVPWKERPSVTRELIKGICDHHLGAPRVRSLPVWRLLLVDNHIKANLSRTVRLAELANVAGLSKMHFAAAFKAATSYSPHEYITALRVEEAKVRLLDPSVSIVDIALGVGYNSQAHFSTIFRRSSGFTPAEWRRSHVL